MPIPDLLELKDVPAYVRKRTGVTVKAGSVQRWQMETFHLPRQGRKVFTTKGIVDDFIRRHIRQGTHQIRHRTYEQLADQSRG